MVWVEKPRGALCIKTDCEKVEKPVKKVFTIENEDFSMSVLPKQMADQSKAKNESLGRGGKVVNFSYSSSHFGPIYVKDDNEIKDLFEIAKSNINELKYKDLNGGRSCKGFYHSAAATRARTNLPQDIINYLDYAFTKKGIKDNIPGRKKRNYPKRSKIIKIDPNTGQYVYPSGQVVPNIKDIEMGKHSSTKAVVESSIYAKANQDDISSPDMKKEIDKSTKITKNTQDTINIPKEGPNHQLSVNEKVGRKRKKQFDKISVKIKSSNNDTISLPGEIDTVKSIGKESYELEPMSSIDNWIDFV